MISNDINHLLHNISNHLQVAMMRVEVARMDTEAYAVPDTAMVYANIEDSLKKIASEITLYKYIYMADLTSIENVIQSLELIGRYKIYLKTGCLNPNLIRIQILLLRDLSKIGKLEAYIDQDILSIKLNDQVNHGRIAAVSSKLALKVDTQVNTDSTMCHVEFLK